MFAESAGIPESMNWEAIKNDLGRAAPFIAGLLGVTGPAGAVAGAILSATLGTPSDPDAVHAALAADPQALEKVRLAEINNAGAIRLAMIQNANEQAATNTAMASHPWLIGWRAILGYACALAVAWQLFLLPIVIFFLGLAHLPVAAPEFNFKVLLSLLGTLLGAATWHLAEGALNGRNQATQVSGGG